MRGQRVARCGEPLSVLEQQGGFALLTGDGPVLVLVGGLLTGWRGLPKAQCDGGVVERYEVVEFVRWLGRGGQTQRARRIQPDGCEQIKGTG